MTHFFNDKSERSFSLGNLEKYVIKYFSDILYFPSSFLSLSLSLSLSLFFSLLQKYNKILKISF